MGGWPILDALSPDDRSARILIEHAGFEIVEAGDRVWFFDRRTRGPIIAASVSGGLAAIASINALLLATSLLAGAGLGASWLAVAIVAALALLASLVCAGSLKLLRLRRARPRAELAAIVIVDRSTQTLLDGSARPLAPVAQVRATRAMLIGSSAPAVTLRLPGGAGIEVYRGTLIGGGVDHALEALARLGFAR